MNRAEAETFPPVSKELRNFRKKLHWAARELVISYGWVARDKVIRECKNIFLWHFYKVETSKALTLDQIREAVHKIKRLNKQSMLTHLEARDVCDTENDLKILTSPQRNKLVRVMVYVIKMNTEAQLTYIEETVGIRTPIGLLTITEADQLIKRVEKWEAKILLHK